jgi:hypothetical protein
VRQYGELERPFPLVSSISWCAPSLLNDAITCKSFVPAGIVTSMNTFASHGQFCRTVHGRDALPRVRSGRRATSATAANHAIEKVFFILMSRSF